MHLPNPASPFAKVPHRQTHELVTARFELHPLQQLARATPVLDAPLCEPAQILCLAGQVVAYPLQLRQREQAGTAGGCSPPEVREICQRDVRERACEDRRAFALEPCDLPPQGTAQIALANLDPSRAR